MKDLVKLVKQKCEESGLVDVHITTYTEKNIVCISIGEYGTLCFKESKTQTNCLICEYFIPMYVDHMYIEDIELLNHFVAKSFLIKENDPTEVER